VKCVFIDYTDLIVISENCFKVCLREGVPNFVIGGVKNSHIHIHAFYVLVLYTHYIFS